MPDSNYGPLIHDNLKAAFAGGEADLARRLEAEVHDGGLVFSAFGGDCLLAPDRVRLDGGIDQGPRGVVVSLLARHARAEACIVSPWRAFRELPDSMPYAGAFRTHTETPLVPYADAIVADAARVCAVLPCERLAVPDAGDCALVLAPLPKIRLCYLFYRADEDFPANVTCLFSANADRFLPTDALADVGEYTSRAIAAAMD
jgi:hypothetical protein